MADKRWQPGKIDPKKAAFTDTYNGRYFIVMGDEIAGDQFGYDVTLVLPKKSYKSTGPTIPLTQLTHEELKTLRKLINLAFEWAEPVVLERDKVANDAFQRGDDSFDRVYRQVPQLVVRKRPESLDSQGLQDGPSVVPDSSGRGEDSDGGVRGASAGLAESVEADGSTQDDRQETD